MTYKIKEYLPVITLLFVAFILAFQNYTPGTFLSGWDTLHPEFNFGLNFQRLFFGVFRSEQGLGAVAAHSHMSDLPRVILLYILNYFAPLSFLRYFYIFLNLLIGPIGMYFFLQKIVLKNKTASFLGALFYLLNLGTIQQFIVPFEMFTTQYAILPWIFLFATQYLNSTIQNKKAVTLFALVMLFASPMAYAATLWYITFACLFLYLFALSLPTLIKKDFFVFKKTITLILLSLLINSFWILPNIYFVLTSGARVTYANINTLFSPQAFLYNKEFGNVKDITLIKNFLFDWGAYMGGNHFGNLLSVWTDHLNKPYVATIGFFFAFVSVLGVAYSIVKKNKIGLSFLPVLILVLFFLINDNPPTSFLYRLLEQNIPLFKEAFRFPADKALGFFIFIFAVYFGLGQIAIIALIKKLTFFSIKFGLIFQTVIISGLLIYYILPAFNGNLISPLMRIKIPNYYFDMFSYFNRQSDNGRIADLPIHSPWGWEYYDWHPSTGSGQAYKPSYQGAGFIWFGIKQPILNRDFDRWNPLNEQYYREMSHAVYSQKDELLKKVIEKYNIHYILLDESIIAPENDARILYYDELKKLLEKLEKENFARQDAQFGKIKIFKVVDNPNYAYLIDNYAKVSPKSSSYYEDFAYVKYKDYITWKKTEDATFYPFRDLIDSQSRVTEDRIRISQEGAEINFKKRNISSFHSIIDTENFISADLFLEKTNNKITINIYPRLPYKNSSQFILPIITSFDFKDTSFIVSINRTSNFAVENLEANALFSAGTVFLNTKADNTISVYPNTPDQIESPDFSSLKFSLSSCEGKAPDQVFGVERQANGFIIFGKKAPVCMTIPLENLFPNVNQTNPAILLTTNFTYNGVPLSYVCVADLKTGSCLNYSFKNISSGSFATNLSYFGIEKNNLSNLSIKVFVDATPTEGLEKVKYSNVSLALTKPVSTASFSKDLIKQSISAARSNLNSVLIPFSGNKEASHDITTLPRNSINCRESPLNHRISKKIISRDKNNYIEYESGEGTACDHFSYLNLLQGEGYLLLVTSRNVQGLPLTMCVLNQVSKHCDLYANLSKSSKFTTDKFLIPPMQGSEKGYDVNIASLGIKGTKSINDLASIQFIPAPYYFLSQMEEGQKQTVSQRVSIENQIDENPSLYSVELNNNQAKNSVLVLSKSYEAGWNVYQMENGEWKMENWIKLAFPFIFGKELKNHVLVNNWENGWKINSSQLAVNNSQNDNKLNVNSQLSIVIIYLPQYLEYLGFLLTLGTLFFIIWLIFKSGNGNITP